MSWNGFGPEGGAVIADALATNNSLLEIDISGNRLNAEAAVKIAKAIFSNDNLRILRVKLILYLHMLLRLLFHPGQKSIFPITDKHNDQLTRQFINTILCYL